MVSNSPQIYQIIVSINCYRLGGINFGDEPDWYADGGIVVELGCNILWRIKLLASVCITSFDDSEYDCKTTPKQIPREIVMMWI